MATDTAQRKSPISARDRARQATARRLAAEQTRLKDNEANLVAFFDATQAAAKVADELGKKVQSLREDAATKTGAAEHAQALALRALLDRGETVATLAEATELSASQVRKLLKRAAGADGSPSAASEDRGRGEDQVPAPEADEELPPALAS